MLFQSNSVCPVCKTGGEPWCRVGDREYGATDRIYSYLRCPGCFTIFIKEVPEEQLSQIYPPGYYSFSEHPGKGIFRLKNAWDGVFFKRILKNINAPELSVLDVGGGAGDVLDSLKIADKRINDTEIVDIDPGAKLIAEKKGHAYTRSTIEDYHTEKKFQLILLLNIIEHVGDPRSVIQKAERMLAPGGLIIIKTPNADSLDARLFKTRYWGGLHCPRHWIIFTDGSFKQMLGSTGLNKKSLKFTQGAAFWAYSILDLLRKKTADPARWPLISHPFFGALAIMFAIFDTCRSVFSKTSQMFVVLEKKSAGR
jgi:2-polyprenyl-3-methyl-5-hydroxy-6-metoxy-1,4-benzoquinol methylase